MQRKHYCYIIKCSVTGKVYVGKTSDPLTGKPGTRHRWTCHRSRGKRYTGCRSHLYNAMRKYGIDNFTFEVVFETSDANLCSDREKELIKELKANDPEFGLNMTEGGDGAPGYKFTDQQRANIREGIRTKRSHKPGPTAGKFGESSSNSKLTESQVIEILLQLQNGRFQRDIARDFGVTQMCISLIKQCKSWPHLPRE